MTVKEVDDYSSEIKKLTIMIFFLLFALMVIPYIFWISRQKSKHQIEESNHKIDSLEILFKNTMSDTIPIGYLIKENRILKERLQEVKKGKSKAKQSIKRENEKIDNSNSRVIDSLWNNFIGTISN